MYHNVQCTYYNVMYIYPLLQTTTTQPKMQKQKRTMRTMRTILPADSGSSHSRKPSSQSTPSPHWHSPTMLARSPPNQAGLTRLMSSSSSWQRRSLSSQLQSSVVRHNIPSFILQLFQSENRQPVWAHLRNLPTTLVRCRRKERNDLTLLDPTTNITHLVSTVAIRRWSPWTASLDDNQDSDQ